MDGGLAASAEDTLTNYFPVTNYLRGQLAEIRDSYVTPLKYIINGDKKDSVWIKPEDLENSFAPFFQPVIDTANMAAHFKESKFNDQSVNAFTFTYDPAGKLPDSIQLRHWDVYVNPETGRVRRVYLVKQISPGTQQQLTWEAEEKWCKILDITTSADGKLSVSGEQKITWKF